MAATGSVRKRIDGTDLKILEMLQRNGRSSLSDIAKAVGLSPPSVGERIRKLEEEGIVRKYVALLDAAKAGREVMAFVTVKVDRPMHGNAFLKRMQELTDVLECHLMAGEADYLLKVRAHSLAALEALVARDIRGIEGVAGTCTAIVLSSQKDETKLSLADLALS